MVANPKEKELIKFIYACGICGVSLQNGVRTVDHYLRIHGYAVPRRQVGRRRPADVEYEYQNDPNGKFDSEHYACGSCWFHVPADKKGLEKLKEHFFEDHHPEKVDKSKDGGRENESDYMEDDQEDTGEERKMRRSRTPSSQRRRSTSSSRPPNEDDMTNVLQKLNEISELFKNLMK